VTSHAGQGAPEHSFLSIREVLDLLVEEFPDVTISKIRFLESRGLIHPERTASGYRKFYESDVERLRWILREQREHFLPLKVIKGRLEQVSGTANGPVAASLFDGDFSDPPDDVVEFVGAAVARPAWAHATTSGDSPGPGEFDEFFEGRDGDDQPARQLDDDLAEGAAVPPGDGAEAEAVVPAEPGPAVKRPRSARARRVGVTPPAGEAEEKAGRTKTTARRGGGRPPRGGSPGSGGRVTGYSAEELARAAGVEGRVVAELDEYGLIGSVEVAGVRAYRPDAVEVVRLAAAFGKYGIEPRHLRTFKHAAEREAGLFSQVVTPLLYQRNPEARARALTEMKKLIELGASLHEAFVRVALDVLGRG
jgi:DNA-binding transcriptional MerR regulator